MKKYLAIALFLGVFLLITHPSRAAEPSFKVNSLNATYYLDRDAKGVSTLAAEEVFDVQFPSSGASFSGFSRSIPTQYQKNTNNLIVTGVTDASGTAVPYSSSYDGDKNLIVKVGNPAITVFGSHSYTIRYQAKGVINFLKDHQEFYPNFNGRGWDTSFGSINAVIHLPKSLADEMSANPECFIDSGKCSLEESKSDKETQISISSLNSLPAHQSMTAKLQFKNGTFKPYHRSSRGYWLNLLAGIFLVLVVLAIFRQIKSSRNQSKHSKKAAKSD